MYSEYLTKEALEELGKFQLVQVICIGDMVNYLLKGK